VAPEDGELRAERRSEGALGAPFPSWFGPEGKLVREGSLEVPVRVGERWVLGVRSRRYDSEHLPSPGPHWLRVVFEPSRDPQEPNDAPEQATLLAPGDARELTFTPRGDRDWFRVVGSGDALLRLELERLSDGLRPQIRWYDAAG